MPGAKKTRLRVAPFRVDVTPPVGHPIAYGVNRKTDSPLYVRGLVVDDGRTRAVVAGCDFIGIAGRAYRSWKRLLGRAAGAPAKQVLLHAIHQHDSVFLDLDVLARVRELGYSVSAESAYWKAISAKLREGVERAVRGGWRSVKRLVTAERRVSRLGANRRLLDEDGKVRAMRFSMCADPDLQREPVGVIDPMLRTIGFLGVGDRVLAALHFYATHPQVAYHRNRAGSDVPGRALRYLEDVTNGEGEHIYLTGCGANVTFGKYAFADKAKSLRVLGKRLGEALAENLRHLEERPLGRIEFAHTRFTLPLQRRFTRSRLKRQLERAGDFGEAKFAARRLILLEDWKTLGCPPIARMSLGPDVHVLSLPSEVVVEYQLHAQGLVADRFLACAAYGDYSYFYLPTAVMYREGGYEPKVGMYTPAIEASLKEGIGRLLEDLRD